MDVDVPGRQDLRRCSTPRHVVRDAHRRAHFCGGDERPARTKLLHATSPARMFQHSIAGLRCHVCSRRGASGVGGRDRA